jgi:hypothetical protein
LIDTSFNFTSDAAGGDPDLYSPTLRRYHVLLWNRPLPDGRPFNLQAREGGAYLSFETETEHFVFGSDAITHSYRNHVRKKHITEQVPDQVNELFDLGCTIGAYVIFPKNRVDGGLTINQARGTNRLIDDRFDLTLECIRRHYLGLPSPLQDTLARYAGFFRLFGTFSDYVRFFLLDDLLDDAGNIRFHLPFDDFRTPPGFATTDDYLLYKENVCRFVRMRNRRIEGLQR